MTNAPETASEDRRVETNGIELAVTEYAASGPAADRPLVLLHGIGSAAVSWWPVIDPLAAEFRLYAVDHRGHGASAKPASGYLLPDYAADLAALLDALGIDRPRLLGHSLGGAITLEWAIRYPERALGIALEEPPLRGGRESVARLDGWQGLAARPVEEVVDHYRREYPDWSPGDYERRAMSLTSTSPGVFRELRDEHAADTGSDRIARLGAIQSPVLLVHGDVGTGGMVAPADAARFAATVPHARVVRVPGASHNIHRDRPSAFLDLVIPFLHGVEVGGSSPQ